VTKYKASINKVDFSDMIELVLKYNIWLDTPVLTLVSKKRDFCLDFPQKPLSAGRLFILSL